MKKNTVNLIFLLLSFTMFSQNSPQWHAVYQYKRILSEKAKQRRDSSIAKQPEMADMLRKIYKRFDNREYKMDFNRTTSIFKEKQKLGKPGESFGGYRPQRELYKNISTQTYTEMRPLMQEVYLIKDSLPKYNWHITNESKQIGKYMVVKAEADYQKEDKDIHLIAWFTPEIPVQNGPSKFGGLPGLILELNNNNEEVYLLKELVINPKSRTEIIEPDKGKVVDEKTYKEEMKKMREKMQKMYKSRRGNKNSGSSHRITIVR